MVVQFVVLVGIGIFRYVGVVKINGWFYLNNGFIFWENLISQVVKKGILFRINLDIWYKIGFCIEKFIDKGKFGKSIKVVCLIMIKG